MRIINIANQKGGVGKSETAKNFSRFILLMKKMGITIDLDPQCSISSTFGADPQKGSIYDVLTKKLPIQKTIQTTSLFGDCVCGSPLLSGADKALSEIGSEYLLQESMKPIENIYDFGVIDSPPSLGLLTINALAATDYLVIPAQADIYSLQGIEQILTTVEKVRKYCRKNIIVSGILLTRFDNRTVISHEMLKLIEDTAKKYGTKVFATKIRECTKIKEATKKRVDLFSSAPKSNATIDYCNFFVEFFKGINADVQQ